MLCKINIILTLTERWWIDWLYVLLKIIVFLYCRAGLHTFLKNVVPTSKFLGSEEWHEAIPMPRSHNLGATVRTGMIPAVFWSVLVNWSALYVKERSTAITPKMSGLTVQNLVVRVSRCRDSYTPGVKCCFVGELQKKYGWVQSWFEGRGFDSRWCHWNFWLTQTFRPHYGPGVDSASNRNEYQEYFLGG